jgi:hypothetical protein
LAALAAVLRLGLNLQCPANSRGSFGPVIYAVRCSGDAGEFGSMAAVKTPRDAMRAPMRTATWNPSAMPYAAGARQVGLAAARLGTVTKTAALVGQVGPSHIYIRPHREMPQADSCRRWVGRSQIKPLPLLPGAEAAVRTMRLVDEIYLAAGMRPREPLVPGLTGRNR